MGKGQQATPGESRLSREQARIARELFERTRGLRGGLLGAAEERLGLPVTQGQPVAGAALFGPQAPEREALELGFAGAREDILSRVPARGGQMNRILSDLETSRARSIGGMEAEATRRAEDVASGAVFTAPQRAIGGLGAAQAGLTAAANREAALQASKGSGMGQLAGSAISAGGLIKAAGRLPR